MNNSKVVKWLFLYFLILFVSGNTLCQNTKTTCDPKLDSIKKIGIEPTLNHLKSILQAGSNCPEDFILYQLSFFSLRNQNYEDSKLWARKGIASALRNNGNFLPDLYNQLGTVHNYESQNDSSIHYFIKSAKLLEEREDLYYSALVENNIGMIYNQMMDHQKAEEYYQKSADKLRSINDSTYLATILANLAVVQLLNGDTSKAETNISASINLGKKINDYVALSISHAQNSSIFQRQGQMSKAIMSGEEALKYAKISNSDLTIIDALNNLTELFLNIGDGQNAEEYAMECKIFMEATGNTQYYSYNLNYLSQAYLLQGNFRESRKYLQDFVNFKDSINIEEQKLVQSELLVQYETEKKENLLLKQSLDLQHLTARNHRLLFFSAIIFLALLFAFLYYKSQLKNKELEVAKVKSETKNQVTEALLQGEENERLRLSKEIHDGLGSMLTATNMHLANLQVSNPHLSHELSIPLEMVRKTHEECRRVAHNLMPVTLYESGLQAAIEEHILLLESTGAVNVEFTKINFSEENLSQNLKLFIFRVIQELISNSIKHGNATEILLQISRQDPLLTITVEDNGNGIDESKTNKGKGLMSLRKNLMDLGGILDIDSKLKEGTSVYIEINMLKW